MNAATIPNTTGNSKTGTKQAVSLRGLLPSYEQQVLGRRDENKELERCAYTHTHGKFPQQWQKLAVVEQYRFPKYVYRALK